jgi:hypothetical protein
VTKSNESMEQHRRPALALDAEATSEPFTIQLACPAAVAQLRVRCS